jgi:hypothetical protein
MDAQQAKELDYGMAMSTQAMIRAMGMQATNNYYEKAGMPPEYTKADFDALIEEFGIHHNAVLTRWQNVM